MDKQNQNERKCPVTGATAGARTSANKMAAPGGQNHKGRRPPSVKLLQKREGLLSLVKRSRRNILEVIPHQSLFRPIISGRLMRRFHIVTAPSGIRQVFKSNIANYPKSPEARGILQKALRHGILVLEGEEWRWQRRALNPTFAPRNIHKLGPLMSQCAAEGVERLAGQSGPVNISREMMTTAFEVIARVTFADGDGRSAVPLDAIDRAINHYLADTGRVSVLDYLGLPSWIPRPGRMRTHPTLKALKEGADKAIIDRRNTPNTENPALLDLLLDAEDPETGRKLGDEELRDNLITFLIAGHETTALTLSWTLYLLACKPATQRKAIAEAQRVLNGRTATIDDVPALGYIQQAIYESMRLYPPIPMHLRQATDDDVVCEHAVKAGDTMLVPFYALHRHRKLWDKPDQFIPERFEDMSKIDRYAYIPFSVGPRVCIGADFAMQEATIILASLLTRYRFKLVEGNEPSPKLILTLRPDREILLEVEPLEEMATA